MYEWREKDNKPTKILSYISQTHEGTKSRAGYASAYGSLEGVIKDAKCCYKTSPFAPVSPETTVQRDTK